MLMYICHCSGLSMQKMLSTCLLPCASPAFVRHGMSQKQLLVCAQLQKIKWHSSNADTTHLTHQRVDWCSRLSAGVPAYLMAADKTPHVTAAPSEMICHAVCKEWKHGSYLPSKIDGGRQSRTYGYSPHFSECGCRSQDRAECEASPTARHSACPPLASCSTPLPIA